MADHILSHGGTSGTIDEMDRALIQKFLSNRGSKYFSLDRIGRIASALGSPHEAFPAFHVAGTNGKGSVSCALAGILGANGKRCVLTISPHLERVNERVVVDGTPISDERLVQQLALIDSASTKEGVQLSLHEAMTLVAFLEGDALKVDYGVFEVGLGGRLDSTNILARPSVGIITSISLDHTDLLGETAEEIAKEKAGIIKPAMKGIVVGKVSTSVLEVIEREATCKGVPVLAWGRDFLASTCDGGNCSLLFRGLHLVYSPPLPGTHQIINSAVALVASLVEGLDPKHSVGGLREVFWPGRLESFVNSDGNRLILDCAHNPDGINQVVDFVRKEVGGTVDCVFGCLATKEWKDMVAALVPITRYWNLLAPPGDRAVPSSEIWEYLSSLGISSIRVLDERDALDLWRATAGRGGTRPPLVVLGSMYMLGRVRAGLRVPERPFWRLSSADFRGNIEKIGEDR